MSLQIYLVLILFPRYLSSAGIEIRPLVSPICLFFCAYVGGGEFASCDVSVLWSSKENCFLYHILRQGMVIEFASSDLCIHPLKQ